MATTIQPATVVYPESDGTPVGETDDHRELMFELIFVLKQLLSTTTAYVAGNLFVYYEEGDQQATVAPDVFVVFGVPQRNRRTYKTWEHAGKGPDVVIELTSAGTRRTDLGEKRVLYADLGVREYYLFDPLGDYLKPQIRGYELVGEELVPLHGPRIFSRLLNVEFRAEGRVFGVYDTQGTKLLTPREVEQARQAEAAARQAEAAARQRAETEVERLRAEVERLRSGKVN